jgi:hypothetical protein
MSKLYIFGDSFSAHYGYDNDFCFNTEFSKIYYKKELENGHTGDYKDLDYYFKKYMGDDVEIVNTAQSSKGNHIIMQDFMKQSLNFKKGDYVSFQTSYYGRYAVVNNTKKIFEHIVPNHIAGHIYPHINFTKTDLEKLCFEYSTNLYYDVNINYINFVKHYLETIGIDFYIWTIDTQLEHLDTAYRTIDPTLRINDKYKDVTDFHPSFEGNEYIVKNITGYWANKKNKWLS